ncbi:MFS transporter [Patescibacteria group bacterium]
MMLQSINRVVRILILSDFFLMAAWGLITPVLAIFVLDKIQGGDASVAGFAVGIYWFLKAIIQIPIGKYLDKTKGEKDDYYFVIFGMAITSLVPLAFIFVHLPWHIYFVQAVHAIGMAMVIPAWGGIFTRHIDKGKEAFTWGTESSSLSFGTGIAAFIGGVVVKLYGFLPLFIGMSVLGIIATLLLFLIAKDLIPKEKVLHVPKPH